MSEITREMASRPFVWGSTDCCLSPCEVLRRLGLPDGAVEWRGQYRDAKGAARMLEARGGLEKVAADRCAVLGWPEAPPESACAGDLGIVRHRGGDALAIFDGGAWCVKSFRGVQRLPSARRAWRTGYL